MAKLKEVRALKCESCTTSVRGNSVAHEAIASADYPCTAADLAVAQLLRMATWGTDWDGSGAAKPLDFSLKEARSFIRTLAPESVVPQPALHAGGHAILFVNSADVYAEVEFLGGHRIGFYARRGGQEWTDEIDFDGRSLPEGLLRAGFVV
jgi:hypothetical protein